MDMATNRPIIFNRNTMLDALRSADRPFDVLVIGGGATGIATALDAASRGHRTVLIERGDFAGGTSSRSTKLVHGGVRYLRQGRLRLVRESLRERRALMRNAPHLVQALPTVIPAYSLKDRVKYSAGLSLYDVLAAGKGIGRARMLGLEATRSALPGIETDGLRGGMLYYDGQTDDARLAITMARTAATQGAVLLNYMAAAALVKENGRVTGVEAEDVHSREGHRINAKVVINAAGIFSDGVRSLDAPEARPVMRWSRGTHIVFAGSLLPGGHGLLAPETADGRVVFALPWLGSTLVGTTDVPMDSPVADPEPPQEDVEFLREEVSRYLPAARNAEMRAAFTGIRPLVGDGQDGETDTAALSRSHRVIVSESRLVTVTGGKWTTARLMAEDAVDRAEQVAGLEPVKAKTASLPLLGAPGGMASDDVYRGAVSEPGYLYGSEIEMVAELEAGSPELGIPLAPTLPYRMSQVVFAVRMEMAETVDDVLSRRTRSMMLDAEAAVGAAREVAEVMASELGRDEEWVEKQVAAVEKSSREYRAPQRV